MLLSSKSFLFLVLFLVLSHCMKIGNGLKIRCIEKERQALLALKQSVKADYDNFLSSWGTEDCCSWEGIQCSNRTGHVISLRFHSLRGKLSPSLLELRHLRYLDLSYNDFEGSDPFPNSNGSSTLSKLRYLNLRATALSFETLYQLANPSKLQFLDFSYNYNDIYILEWFYGLSSLRYLDLSGNDLIKDAKDWPQLLYTLHSLEDLRLSGCHLPQILSPPSSFNFTCSKIIHLDLSGNSLDGDILEFLRNCCTLKTLDLSRNNLSGFSPVTFGCLENSLEILTLYDNRFHGPPILPYFARFSSLTELDLSYNGLNGSLSESFKQPSKLAFLFLEGNQLTGSLPDFTTLPSLEKLYVGDNQLNGIVTESLGSLSRLEVLDLSWNSLKGVVSETHFENLANLNSLDLSHNHNLTLSFNSSWVPPFQLQYIFLSSCKLGPQFLKWLQTQKNIHRLDISGTGISDADWLLDLPPPLKFLNVSHNQMTGKLPNLSSLRFDGDIGMDLSSNMFEGPLPLFPSNMSSLNLAKNKFSGSVSPLCKISKLDFLDVSDNLLSGVLEDCNDVQWNFLSVLNLENNNFSGSISTTFGSLSLLGTFNLRNNGFSGDLPSSLQNCSRLQFLDVSENKLSGNIPTWIGENLSSLVFLSMRANKFNGKIPADFCRLTEIRILDLSQNQLSGRIPLCLNNLTAMSQKGKSNDIIEFNYIYTSEGATTFGGNYIEKAWVGWKGKKYEYEKYLGLFRIIDFADNKLVGEIPSEITNLSELVVLNLSGNSLIGPIPKNIGLLKQIQSLDLSRNHLSGRIPNSMADLSFMSFLDLSYNNLSGRIPLSTQLQSMDPSAFSGNQALCGPPISRLCPEDIKPPHQPNASGNGNGGNGNGDEFSEWFYAGMGLGFCVGFWGVCGSLLLKRSWRHAYFRLLDHLKNSLCVTFMLWKARLLRKLKS